MPNRIIHIDIAKGISIILVALYHSGIGAYSPGLTDSMSLFRMPLFFFLSGIFFRPSMEFRRFTLRKADALLKPYLVTMLIVMAADAAMGRGGLLWTMMVVLFGNGFKAQWIPLWFLPHLWLVFMAAYGFLLTTRLQERSVAVKAVCVVLLILIGSYRLGLFWKQEVMLFDRPTLLPGLPFGLDILPITIAFFLLGMFLRERAIRFRPSFGIMLGCAAVYGFVSLATGAEVDLNERTYAEPLSATVGALCGIIVVMNLSSYLQRIRPVRKILIEVGRSSLFILVFHLFVHTQADRLYISVLGGGYDYAVAAASFCLSIAVPVLLRSLVVCNPFLSRLYLPRPPTIVTGAEQRFAFRTDEKWPPIV